MSKRALPLLTGGLNELTRSDLIDDSQLQQCDNYEVVGDGTLKKRKSTSIFDNSLDQALFGTYEQVIDPTTTNMELSGDITQGFTTDYGLFGGEGNLIKISEPYYFPTDIDLENSEYSTLESDYLLLVYGYTGTAYEMHMLYKADSGWRKYAVYNDDDTTETLSELLVSSGITYTSDSDPQFAFAEDKIIITDGVNNAHYVAIDENGVGRAGKMGLPSPRNRARIEPMTSVDKSLFETDTTQTYVSAPGLVQVTYTVITKYGDESNPAPVSQTFDMQYNKIGEDGITSHYIDKIKVHDLTVPDVSDNVMETIKYFNFYIRIVPYKAGIEVGSLIYTEQQEINSKTISGIDTGNSYVLTLPPLGDTVSYENDVAPIANTAAQLGGITMLGNVQDNVRFPFTFKYFHSIKINNMDSASYVDGNIILRLYDKDSGHEHAIDNLDFDDFVNHGSGTQAGFLNTSYFRIYDEDLTTPLYCGFVVADNGGGDPASYKTIDEIYGSESNLQGGTGSIYGIEYVDLIIQIPYLTANLTRTIYLCWTPEADQSSYPGVTSPYNDLTSGDTSTYNGNLGIHYGKVMNINSDGFSRQQFFKGSMLDNDQTYISYPFELSYEGAKSNRANLNNKISGDVDIVNNDVSFPHNTITYVRGFKAGAGNTWSNRINTGAGTVGANAMQLKDYDSGALLNADQYDGTPLSETAGWVSFMYDAFDGEVLTDSSEIDRKYLICNIWGIEPTLSADAGGYSVISLFAQRFYDNDDLTGTEQNYYMYLNDWRYTPGTVNASSKWLGQSFKLYGAYGSQNSYLQHRYLLITWNSDTSSITVWSGHQNGDIVYKTFVDWDFSKLTDGGEFNGVQLGGVAGANYGIKDSRYDDVQMQLGEYLDPTIDDSRARFANIMNQFPAYDNIIGYKHTDSQDTITYNNNITFTKTEVTDSKPRKNMVRWSDVNRNAFPDLFFKSVREPIIKVVPAPSFLQYQYQNTFLIFTRNSINRFVLEGNASGWQGSASSLIEEKTQYGLFAPDTLVRIGEALFWLSEVGVVMWDKDGLRLISKNIVDIDLGKTYFAFENSIMNQYILSQKHPDIEQFVYHVDRNLWTKFNNMGNGTFNKGITTAVSLTGGSQLDNINLIYGHSDDEHIYNYPGTGYTSEDSTIKTKEMFFEKGILRRVKAGYTGDDKSFTSILTKDDTNYSETTKEHTVALEENKWRGIPLGYNRGKSVVFKIDNADTIKSIMYDLDIHAEVTV